MPLLTDIQDATGGTDACSILQVPLQAVRSAADSLAEMRDNPPAGIRQLADQLRRIELPKIDKTEELAEAFRALRAQLPTDTSAVTGQLSEAVDGFFGDLGGNLTGQLDSTLGAFGGLNSLSQLNASQPVDDDIVTRLQSMLGALDSIPEPLNVKTLLEYLLQGLQKFPRGIFPYRYLPFVDELRDKIETTLAWNAMKGTEIAAHLEESTLKLAHALRQTFVTDGVGVVSKRLDHVASKVNAPLIVNALDGMGTALSSVAQAVQGGNLSLVSSEIAALVQHRGDLEGALLQVDEMQVVVQKAQADFEGLPNELEDRALHFLGILQPPTDLSIVSGVFKPISALLEQSGLNVFLDKIEEFIASIRGVLDALNLNSIKDTLLNVIGGAVAAVDGLRNVLMRVTIEFSALMERVSDAIESLGISQVIQAMEDGLRNFIQLVRQTADTIFAPVRSFLHSIFETINGFLEQLDPSVVVSTIKNILSKFTDLLSNPQLLDAIDTVKGALDTVNGELANFQFKPGTDIVVQGIGIVEEALKIASGLPLPDSIKKELRDALNQLPKSIDPAVDIISDGLDDIVEDGPKPFLLQVKVGPAKLVEIISQYSPEKLVNDCIGNTYQDFLTEMERFKPTDLLVPVQQALDVVKTEVRRIADPAALLGPLQEPFDELLALLDAIDPVAIIEPVNTQLQAGIQTIIDALPLEAANEIFDIVGGVADKIQSVADTLGAVHDFFDGFRQKLAGLADARTQAQTLGSEIASRIDTVSDLSGMSAAMAEVGNALTAIHAAGLSAVLVQSIGGLSAKLEGMDAKNKLAALAAQLVSFPKAQLALLPASLEKTNLETFLNEFKPLSAALAAPIDMMDRLPGQLHTQLQAFDQFLNEWDGRFLEPTGPIMRLHQPSLTVSELRTMLRETVQKQLMDSLDPIMQMIEYFQGGLDGILVQLAGLISDIQEILTDFLAITDALEEVRVAVNSLVDTLRNFNLNFIAEEFEAVFDALRGELAALSPAKIAEVLREAFDEILTLLDINQLIGAAALDASYLEIVTELRRLDPGKIIIDSLQPAFEAVLEFLMRFDLSVQIDAFLANIDRLKAELRAELTRVADAYEEMWNAIPSSIGPVTGKVTVTVTVTAST